MNFALLGDDPAALPIVAAIADHSGHALTQAALAGETTLTALLQIAPRVRVVDSWIEWSSGDDVDMAIIAGHGDAVLEAARRLASAGLPLLIVPAAEQGLAFVYEMTLIRDDTRVALCPAFLQRFEPAVAALKSMIDAGELGRLMHVQLERSQQPAGNSDSLPLLSQSDIDDALLDDVDLLRFLGGRYNQVTAVNTGTPLTQPSPSARGQSEGAGAAGVPPAPSSDHRADHGTDSPRAAMAQVTFAGAGVPEATWSLRATQPGPLWKLLAIGEKRTVALSRDDAASPLRLEADDVETFEAQDDAAAGPLPAERLLENCEATTSGEPAAPDWTDLTHAFELVDAARRSVRRRRTIDVLFERASERSVFKTQMTAVGCGLLVFTFLAVVAVLIVGALFEPNEAVMRVLRGLAFLPLVVFLLLQVLLLVTRPAAGEAVDAGEMKGA